MGEKDELLHVKRILSETKRDLNIIGAHIRSKAAKRNFLIRKIFSIRKEEQKIKGEIAKLDNEIHALNIKRFKHQKMMNEAKKLGLW